MRNSNLFMILMLRFTMCIHDKFGFNLYVHDKLRLLFTYTVSYRVAVVHFRSIDINQPHI